MWGWNIHGNIRRMVLTEHDVQVGVLVRRFLFVSGEGECQGQGADTAAVHVDNQDELGHPIPVGAFARGETAGGEGRGGLKQSGQQLHVRLYHREHKAGNGDESQRQQQNGGGSFH